MTVGRIYVCHPGYGGGVPASHQQFWIGCTGKGSPLQGKLFLVSGGNSLLCSTFNSFWAKALNMQLNGDEQEKEITHFAMLHDDVIPDTGWLDILVEDLESSGADLMAAVVPIKDPFGLTSTAIDDPVDECLVERRLTLNEVMGLPDIFTSSDCGYPDRALLANTGCWVCKFTDEWRYNIHFRITDRIKCYHEEKDGKLQYKWMAGVAPEDWNFSRDLHKMGKKVMCTKRVKLNHVGTLPFSNRMDWGELKYDTAFGHKFGNVPINTPKSDVLT